MANSLDPDETTRYEPSHLGLHCLHRCMYWSAGMKWLSIPIKLNKSKKGLPLETKNTQNHENLKHTFVQTKNRKDVKE